MRPTLKVKLGLVPASADSSIELNGQMIFAKSIEVVADAENDKLTSVLIGFHPEHLELDLDARSIRLNGAQLPEEVGRALLAQLLEMYK